MTDLLHDHHFWVLISMAIFVIAVWKPASRAVTGMLDERAARIRSELEEARRLREEAEQLLAEYRQQQQQDADHRSKTAMISTCAVCGNMFATPAAESRKPLVCTSTPASRASVAGSHDT